MTILVALPLASAQVRPELHDQAFCTIFLHQSCERSRKFMTHYCGHRSSSLLNSPCEKENQCLESFAEFLRKKTPFSSKKTELLALTLKILGRIVKKNTAEVNRKNKYFTNIKQ